jgi:hypothetical protein
LRQIRNMEMSADQTAFPYKVFGTAWQQAIMGKVTVEQALNVSAAKWIELKKQS